MSGTPRQDRIKDIFDRFDVDQDQVITADDFERMATRASAAFAPPSDQAADDLREACARYWELIRRACDVDHDGGVTREEFSAAIDTGAVGIDDFSDMLDQVVDVLIAGLDPDRKGHLTADAYVRLFTQVSQPAEDAKAAFGRLTAQTGGELRFDDFRTAVKDMYFSHDTGRPGTRIFDSA